MKKVLIFLLLFSSAVFVQAQLQKYYFKQIINTNGLPQNTINCIAEDINGVMWLGTQNGLCRFDGQRYTTYYSIRDNKFTIPANDIQSLVADGSGNVWVGTQYGLAKYSLSTGKFERIALTIPGNGEITKLSDFGNELLVGTRDGILCALQKKTNQCDVLFKSGKRNKVLALGVQNGNVYCGFENEGLIEVNMVSKQYRNVLEGKNINCTVTSILSGSDNVIYIAVANLGVVQINLTTKKKDNFSLISKEVHIPFISDMSIVENNIIASTQNGLYALNVTTNEFVPITINTDRGNIFKSITLTSLHYSKNGLLWVGSFSEGVFLLHQKINMLTVQQGLTRNEIVAIDEDNEGNIWLGHDMDGGVTKFDPNTNHITNFKFPNAFLSGNNVFSVKGDGSGRMWFGNWPRKIGEIGSLGFLDQKTGVAGQLYNEVGTHFYKNSITVLSIEIDPNGKVFIGTLNDGMIVLDRITNQTIKYQHQGDNPNSLSDDLIHKIFRSSDGKIWIGTRNGGVNLFDGNGFRIFKSDVQKPKGLPCDAIMFITEDNDGVIWVGTDRGLAFFDKNRNEFVLLQNGALQEENSILSMVNDKSGYIWFTTLNGLYRFSSKDRLIEKINLPEIVNPEFIMGGAHAASDGHLYFASLSGLIFFKPEEILVGKHAPQIVPAALKKYYDLVAVNQDIATLKHIDLQHYERDITIEFAALDYLMPKLSKYSYYLEGYDESWRYAGNQNWCTYTNLPYGEYALHVRAANSAGIWSNHDFILTIAVHPPWYLTTVSKIIGLILFLSIIIGLYVLRINYLKRKQGEYYEKKRILEELETARSMQFNLLPKSLPASDSFRIWFSCKLAFETGGDFYDAFWIDEKHTRFCIITADVSGKAMQAAILSILLTGIIAGIKKEGITSVNQMLNTINSILHAKKPQKRSFAALSAAIFDFSSMMLYLCNAGQPEIVLVRENNVSFISTENPRVPLGSFKNVEYNQTAIPIKKGDIFVFYTDAFVESPNSEKKPYGYERFFESVNASRKDNLEEFGQTIIADLESFLGQEPQYDDATLILFRISDKVIPSSELFEESN